MNFKSVPLLLALAGCSSPAVQHMPAEIVTAAPSDALRTEVFTIEKTLRPQDVLDLIFYIDHTSVRPYRIQPGDQVEINFLTAPELSGTKLVMPDGTIELPYVGTLAIAGMTALQAQDKVIGSYQAILKRPVVSLSVPRPLTAEENLRLTLTHPATGLSREITVGSDGRAMFPLIGAVALQGMTLAQLNTTLNERYAAHAANVQVDALLKSTSANEIFVLGEVTQPGVYPIRRPVSVLEALTLAHGANPLARLDSVVIMRRKGDQMEARLYDVGKALDASADTFAYLQPDDLLYVPKTKLARAGEISRQVADVLLFNGVGFGFSYRVDNKDDDN